MLKRIISSNAGQSLIIGLILLLVSKGLDKYGGFTMKDIFQTFIVELWYVWVGIIGALIYYYIKSFNDLKKWINYPNIDSQKNQGNVSYNNLMEAIENTIDRRSKKQEGCK
jgi:hypothetical protein